MVLEYVWLCLKLSPLLQGGHKKFLIQCCVSFDQHCMPDKGVVFWLVSCPLPWDVLLLHENSQDGLQG